MAKLIVPKDTPDLIFWDLDSAVAPGGKASREDVMLVQFLLLTAMILRAPDTERPGSLAPNDRRRLADFSGQVDLSTQLCIIRWQNAAYGNSDGRISRFVNGRATFGPSNLFRSLALLQLDYVHQISGIGGSRTRSPSHASIIRQIPFDPRCPGVLGGALMSKPDPDPAGRSAEVTEGIVNAARDAIRSIRSF